MIGTKFCNACDNEIPAGDRFCRRCGTPQTELIKIFQAKVRNTGSLAETREIGASSPFATVPLTQENSYRLVSGPLVKSVTESLAARKTARLSHRWSKRVVMALISIPIWLLIVLLSPIDAYAAARNTIDQM